MSISFASDHPLVAVNYWFLRKISRPIVRLFLVKEITGLKNIPYKGSAILAFNHQSFFDFICTAAVMPRNIHYLSAEKFFEHRWWRKLMVTTGQIKVERNVSDKSSVHEMVARHVDKGTLIGIFPEGTRSPHPKEMLKAFTGVAQFALKHHVPIIPIGIQGTFEVMGKNDRRPKIKRIVKINIGSQLYFDNYHDRHDDKISCVYVTERVIKEIEKLSGKIYPHYESITT